MWLDQKHQPFVLFVYSILWPYLLASQFIQFTSLYNLFAPVQYLHAVFVCDSSHSLVRNYFLFNCFFFACTKKKKTELVLALLCAVIIWFVGHNHHLVTDLVRKKSAEISAPFGLSWNSRASGYPRGQNTRNYFVNLFTPVFKKNTVWRIRDDNPGQIIQYRYLDGAHFN